MNKIGCNLSLISQLQPLGFSFQECATTAKSDELYGRDVNCVGVNGRADEVIGGVEGLGRVVDGMMCYSIEGRVRRVSRDAHHPLVIDQCTTRRLTITGYQCRLLLSLFNSFLFTL